MSGHSMKGGLFAGWDHVRKLWRMLSCLNIDVTRWNFGAKNEILGFAFLLFLWDNASQKLKIPLDFAKWKPLICTLYSAPFGSTFLSLFYM